MKNRASAREEKGELNNIMGHGGLSRQHYSLWLIIFASLIFSIVLFFRANSGLAQKKEEELSTFFFDQVQRVTLDNGMLVLLKENHRLPLVNLFLCVLSGSAQEGKLRGSGVAHFTEHLVFKGTARRAVGQVFKEIESFGGTINAFTSYDYTGYTIMVPSEFALAALDILADLMTNATFEPGELEKEKQVVLKEIRQNYDNPQRYASRVLWQTAFSKHPYRYPVIGEEQAFNDLTRKDVLEFYREKYLPNNIILTVVGDLQKEKTLAFIKKAFQDFSSREVKTSPDIVEPKQRQLQEREEKFTSGLTYLLLGFHSVALTDKDTFALDILGTILGEGKSSRLYRLICGRKRLAYDVGAINYTPEDPGLFIISALLEEVDRQKVLSLIFSQIDLLKKRKVFGEELETAKNKIISSLLFHNQTLAGQAREIALNEAIAGNFRFSEKYIEKIKEVTAEEILLAANKYLNQRTLSTIALTPRIKPARKAQPVNLNEKLTIDVEYLSAKLPAAAFSNPLSTNPEPVAAESKTEPANQIKKYLLGNGATLLVRENKELPIVSLKAVFKGGLLAEDQGNNGICNLTAKMLEKGTKTRSTEKIAELVESKGAHLSSFSGNNSFALSVDLLSKDFDQLFELLADLIIHPTFPQREFKREKEKNLALIKAQEDDIFEAGIELLKSTLFTSHPYRFLNIGNERSLKRLKRRDLINLHRNLCVGNNMVLAVFGDVDGQAVQVKANQLFAQLKPGNSFSAFAAEEPPIKAIRSDFKALPKQQSILLMGFPGTTVANSDRYVLTIICQLLSRGSGRLFTQIREKQGLAYSLGAYPVFGLAPGYLVIYVATTSEHLEIVKTEVLQQLKLLKLQPISEQELQQAKRAIIGQKLISRQTNAACALESSLDELYGLGYNQYLNFSRQIEAVTPRDITRCAKQYFDFNKYAVVVVGP